MDANTSASTTPQNKEEPKKFIRTFSSDVAFSEQGKTPDLIPFVGSSEATSALEPKSVAPVPVSEPVPTKTPESPKPFPSFHDLPEEVKVAFEKKNKQSSTPRVERNSADEYVRTFMEDMKSVKKGSIPGLSLFRKAPAIHEDIRISQEPITTSVKESFLAQEPSVMVAAPVPLPQPTPAERLVASSPVGDVNQVLPGATNNTSLIQKEKTPVTELLSVPVVAKTPVLVKTYGSDFSDKIKETNATPITVLAAEQDAATYVSQDTAPKKQQSFGGYVYGIAGTLLIVLSVVGVYVAYARYGSNFRPVLFEFTIPAPIFVEDREELFGTKSVLADAVATAVQQPLASNSVRLLYTASSTANVESVFSALGTPAPDILRRNIRASGSMAGVVNVGGNQSPFFILSVDSYAETFSGMLAWEPNMQGHLKQLYPLISPQEPEGTVSTAVTIASTTMSTRRMKTILRANVLPANIEISKFVDEVAGNHDVRVYRDTEGRGIIVYGYWNPNILVIARDTVAFTEILQRLATSRAR